jgi:hypothetical protein
MNNILMKLLNYIKSKIYLTLGFILIATFCVSCGIYKPVDARKVSPNADERVKKNLEEGKGFTLMGGNKNKGGTNYSFASSNPMWRATLEILDFIPLSNIDYSGGIIITDWYNDGTSGDEAIKITVRFLTTEVRADGIRIIVHKKKCNSQQNCKIQKVNSILENELQVAILRKAAIFERDYVRKNKKKRPDLK